MSVPASHATVPRGLLPLRFLLSAIAGSLPFRKEVSLFLIAISYSASFILRGVGLTQRRTKACVVVVSTSRPLCKRSLSPRRPLVPKPSGLLDRGCPDWTVAAVDLYSGTEYRTRCPPMEGLPLLPSSSLDCACWETRYIWSHKSRSKLLTNRENNLGLFASLLLLRSRRQFINRAMRSSRNGKLGGGVWDSGSRCISLPPAWVSWALLNLLISSTTQIGRPDRTKTFEKILSDLCKVRIKISSRLTCSVKCDRDSAAMLPMRFLSSVVWLYQWDVALIALAYWK